MDRRWLDHGRAPSTVSYVSGHFSVLLSPMLCVCIQCFSHSVHLTLAMHECTDPLLRHFTRLC